MANDSQIWDKLEHWTNKEIMDELEKKTGDHMIDLQNEAIKRIFDMTISIYSNTKKYSGKFG